VHIKIEHRNIVAYGGFKKSIRTKILHTSNSLSILESDPVFLTLFGVICFIIAGEKHKLRNFTLKICQYSSYLPFVCSKYSL
jgi:hypothetical protein